MVDPARPGVAESRPETGRSAMPRALRRGAVLLLVAALSVPLVLAPDRLAIAVDGRVVEVRSYASTVGEALSSAGVEVGPDDRVVPEGGAPVADGLGISVIRAIPVALVMEGRTHVLPVAGETVGDVLVAAGIGDVRGLSITPDPDTPLTEARRVEVVRPVTVTVRVDGAAHVVHMRPGTVRDALRLAGIEVRRRDDVSMPLGASLRAPQAEVRITRRDAHREVEDVRLPFHEQVVPDADLYVDEQEVVREGSEGVRRDTYRVVLVDGVETQRRLVSQEVVTEPVDRVVHVGTTERPAPEPEPAPPPAPADDDSVWDRLAQCETGGNWAAQGAYHGGLQFAPDTWTAWKLDGYPTYAYEATREQQIAVGKRLQAARGWSPWPYCAEELGLS